MKGIKIDFKKFFLTTLIFLIIIMFVLNPKKNICYTLDGLNLWAKNLLPALFPFFFLSRLLISLGGVNRLGQVISPITSNIYNVSGSSGIIYLISAISGYPMGAKLVSDMYSDGYISSTEAHRITTFTSTSGPLFIIGTVAIGMFNNTRLGIILLVSHMIGSLINGLFYRNYKMSDCVINNNLSVNNISHNDNILSDAMYESIRSILVVGGYVSLFYLLISMLNDYGIISILSFLPSLLLSIFGVNSSIIRPIISGMFEMTRGCLDLSNLPGLSLQTICPILSLIIAFGGISVFMQAYTFLSTFKMRARFFWLSKTTQAIVTTVVSIILSHIFL